MTADARLEHAVATQVVAMCKLDAKKKSACSEFPFDLIWKDVKRVPLSVVFSQAKMLIEGDESLTNDEERTWVYLSLGKFFRSIFNYSRSKGVILKVRNGT